MKDRKSPGSFVPFVISSVFLIASAVALRYFYGKTYFMPFLLLAFTWLLPVALSLIAWLFRSDLREPHVPPKAPPVAASAAAEPAEGEEITPEELAAARTARRNARRAYARKEATRIPRMLLRTLVRAYNKARLWSCVLLSLGAFGFIGYLFFAAIPGKINSYSLGYIHPIFLAVVFVVCIILEKWVKHTETEDAFARALLQNVRSAMAVGRILLLAEIATCMVKLLGFYDLQTVLIYVGIAVFCYQAAFLLFAFAVRFFKHELFTTPGFRVPVPFAIGSDDDLSLVAYLEHSTGITMRSLWSIKLIRHILPYTVVAVVLCVWLSTGVVQVEPYQEGAVYRFGVLQEETLSPGLHFVFPAPVDRVELHDTEVVNSVTIGYRSEEIADNLWTMTHGEEEYKLLLGGGNELVSINLRLEYKIGDLQKYLRSTASPEALMQAMAYELVTDRTISTDLDTLLSIDRMAFASTFKEELTAKMAIYDLGVEVVSVVLESIHPPVEIAATYQELISAEIKAAQYMYSAQGTVADTLARAEQNKALTIGVAREDYNNKVAAAHASVAEFMAAVEAYETYPDAYCYEKYLSALVTAYSGSKLVIVGEGIDTKNIYIGNVGSLLIQ